jgi:DMSO/TMAO reductase YedYZ molybdopterin-dependent catalytic subunit
VTATAALPPRSEDRPRSATLRALAALAGLLAAGFAIAVGDFVAGFFRNVQSPRDAVGSEFIDHTPAWLKDFAIDQFGTHDKTALRVGILIVIALLGMLFGALAYKRPWIGVAGMSAFGVAGALIAVGRPDGRGLDALPPVVGALAGSMALLVMLSPLRALPVAAPGTAPARDSWVDRVRVRAASTERKAAMNRRGFFLASSAVALGAVAAGGAASWLRDRFNVANSRANVVLPRPASTAAPVAADAQVDVAGVSKFLTPNSDFYRIDTALSVPQVTAESWKLRGHGMVDHELELTFAELLKRPAMERIVTLTCVSNEVGGNLVSNARWLGTSLADLLREVGVHPDANQLKSTSADGWTSGTPVATIMDGRDAMLAYAMNGEPLPAEHGFPVRMVVPGLYGYVSATKWVTDLELTTFDAFDAYWVRRGWSQQAPIKTESRIDVPRPLARVPRGRVAVAGVAWAQHRGISAVEVRVDDGPWRPADLAAAPSVDCWREWKWTWDATPGNHRLQVRATDATGAVQPEERVDPIPDGATGWHSVVVRVS